MPDDEGPTEIDLSDDYEAAWEEWVRTGEAALWEDVVGDGIE